MSLAVYKKKRSFSKTPEPKGGRSDSGKLTFVIQKHDASHLHYDFRLEMEGVLKSWAVPKGPSTDPAVKRLAMMVEDHPYDYRNFEGIIPKGEYGGGTVIIWDQGTYHSAAGEFKTKKEEEKNLLKQLKEGKLFILLNGKKLKGEFVLVKSHYQGNNSWLLMKAGDEFSGKKDITSKDKSVVSGKTIAQMEKNPVKIYGKKTGEPGPTVNDKPKTKTKKTAGNKVRVKAARKTVPVKKKSVGIKKAMPSKLAPMLATLVDKPFDEEGWQYEVKWDGYRCLAFIKNGKVELKSRNDKSFNEKFYPVHKALQKLKADMILDGEVVVTDDAGISNFGQLQNWRSEADGDLKFYAFDIIWLEGRSLLDVPLSERRSILLKTIPEAETIKISQSFNATGTAFFEVAMKTGLEGIMAKKSDSVYTPGDRTRNWLKIKTGKRQEVVIGGFTKNDGSSKSFSSLLVGVFNKGKLMYTGKIGTGFSDEKQKEMIRLFTPLIVSRSPFETDPDINKPSRFRPDPPHATATWLKPTLVCEVSYAEMTSDGVMRHPSFQGMREDKPAKEVKLEKEIGTKTVIRKNSILHKKNIIMKGGVKERKSLLNLSDATQERSVNGHPMKFSNLDKLYWPEDKITKRDMLNYYYQVAPFILPYMKDRPQSLNRHPDGYKGMSFYQKDVKGKVPDWIETFPYKSEGDKQKKEFLVCSDEASLLYIASLGCIEMNPWSSTVKKPDNPDWCIIDLDPDKNPYDKVVEVAQVTKQLLDQAGISCYCKTSGSTGMHIYIPLGAKYNYEASKEFARLIVTIVQQQLPGFTSIERATKNRKGKIYLDFLQNRPQATLATAYSLRPKPHASVSMPLHWEEVKKGLKVTDFTIKNSVARLKENGDIFKPVLGKGINIDKCRKKLESIMG